eukprot:1689674-Heterocapsa_arctica.AAC.1
MQGLLVLDLLLGGGHVSSGASARVNAASAHQRSMRHCAVARLQGRARRGTGPAAWPPVPSSLRTKS